MIPQIPAAGNAGQQEISRELGSSGVQCAPRYPAPPENSLESVGIHPQNELGGSQPPLAGRRPFPGIPRESCVAWTPLLEVLLRKDEPAADPRSSLWPHWNTRHLSRISWIFAFISTSTDVKSVPSHSPSS